MVITAEALYAAIAVARPTDGIIVQESLSTLRDLRRRLPTDTSRSFFGMSSGVLGFGLAAAVGVALAGRDKGGDRKVIAIVGDGAANYVIQSPWTAAWHGSPILFVIPCNHAYNILKSFSGQLGAPALPGPDIPGLAFVSLAAGYGVPGERAEQPDSLAGALRTGMAAAGPYLVEVDPAVPPLI